MYEYVLTYRPFAGARLETTKLWAKSDLLALSLTRKIVETKLNKDGHVICLYNNDTKTHLINKQDDELREMLEQIKKLDETLRQLKEALL